MHDDESAQKTLLVRQIDVDEINVDATHRAMTRRWTSVRECMPIGEHPIAEVQLSYGPILEVFSAALSSFTY